MSNHNTIEERNALLDRDVRFARLSMDLEKRGHEVVKRVSQSQHKVAHVAMDAVVSWTKKETFAFEPYTHEDTGICCTAQTLFGIRLRNRFAQDLLQDKLNAKFSMRCDGDGICFQPFIREDGVPFLMVLNTNPDGSRSLLSWADFRAGRFQPLQAGTPGKFVFKAMEEWVRSQLQNDGQDLAYECVEKIEEWQDDSGLCARRQFPQLYSSNCQKHPHDALLKENGDAARTWLFGAKVSQGQSGEWSQQLVTFTCTKDGQPSTIPCNDVDIALRSREAWAEMLQCDAGSYDDCLFKALRDAHFMESPGEDWNNLHLWLSPKHKDARANVVQETGVKDVATLQDVPEKTAWLAKTGNTSEQAEDMSRSKEEYVFVDGGQLEGSQGAAMRGVRDLLHGLKLNQYLAMFEKQGYDDVDSMREMTGLQLQEMMNCVQMVKPGHQERLKTWHEAGAADETTMSMLDSQLDPAAHGQPPYYQQFEEYPAYGNQWAHNSMTPMMHTDQWGYQGWNAEGTRTEYPYWNSTPSYGSQEPDYKKLAMDAYGTRWVQDILFGTSRDDSGTPRHERIQDILRVVAQNLLELMSHPNGIFVVKACFTVLLPTSVPDVGEQFSATACDAVMKNWELLVSGRTSAFSYKMVMWTLEFLYMKSNEQLQAFCQKALDSAQQLVSSHYGHLVLQHAVLFTQKALVRAATAARKATWEYIRSGFFKAAIQALRDRDAWDKRTNSASHFINKCLELLSSDPTKELKYVRVEIIKTVANDDRLLGLICNHLSGQFTARRIYELASSRDRKTLEKQAWLHRASIDKPELRDLEKFKASLLMPDEAAELDFPRLDESLGGRLADLQNLQ